MRAAVALFALALPALALAIGKPKAPPVEPPKQEQPAEPKNANVQPTDETAMYAQMYRVSTKQIMLELTLPEAVKQQLRDGDIDKAVDALNKLNASGDETATLALMRIARNCNRINSVASAPPVEKLDNRYDNIPPERAARILGVMKARHAKAKLLQASCVRAKFNYAEIQNQLGAAAENGKPASVVEAAKFTNDPKQRTALLEAAAAKNFLPGMYALAVDRLYAVQRGDTTENVSSIRTLLKQAAREYPTAKIQLANCMSTGCDGHPAEPANAAVFGVDAAKDGEPTAYASMAYMPWGVQFTREQLIAWQLFGDKLNEAGCFGEHYEELASQFLDTTARLEKGLPSDAVKRGHDLADQYWTQFSPRAKREQGCD